MAIAILACLGVGSFLFDARSGTCTAIVRTEDNYGDPLPRYALARIGTCRLRHAHSINHILFSPDGKHVAARGLDGVLKLWEVTTGKNSWKLASPGEWSHGGCVAFAPNGKVLAWSANDETIKIVDVSTGEVIRELPDHRNWSDNLAPRCLQFDPTGQHLAVGARLGGECEVSLWSVTEGKRRSRFRVGSHPQSTIAFSSSARLVAFAVPEQGISIWNTATGRRVQALPAVKEGGRLCAFSPDQRYLASGGLPIEPLNLGSNVIVKQVCIWELATGKCLFTLPCECLVFEFSPDGRTFASVGVTEKVRIWDLATGEERRELGAGDVQLECFAFSPTGRLLATGSEEGVIRFWDVSTGNEALTLAGYNNAPVPVAFVPKEGTTVLVHADEQLDYWDLSRKVGKHISVRRVSRFAGLPGKVILSPDGIKLLSGGGAYGVKLWDYTGRKMLRELRAGSALGGVAFQPNGDTFTTTSLGTISLWDGHSGTLLKRLIGHNKDWEISVAFAADNKTLVSGERGENVLRIWDVAQGKELDPVSVEKDEPVYRHGQRIQCSPSDDVIVAVGSPDDTLRVWNRKARRLLFAIPNADCFVFAPDGTTIAVGTRDALIRLHEIPTGKVLCELRGHEGGITGLVFRSDGQILASGSADHTVLIWDLRLARSVMAPKVTK